jgi:hypothetical protein
MPDNATHQRAADLAGLGIGLYSASELEGWPALCRILGCVVDAKLAAALPDLLEPAISSWHRGSLHSYGALASGVTVAGRPPAWARDWIAAREQAADRARRERESLQTDHPDRAGLWLAEMAEHFAIGVLVGAPPGGYVSHLLLDAGSPRGLPLL